MVSMAAVSIVKPGEGCQYAHGTRAPRVSRRARQAGADGRAAAAKASGQAAVAAVAAHRGSVIADHNRIETLRDDDRRAAVIEVFVHLHRKTVGVG